jgi:hypothetical protein
MRASKPPRNKDDGILSPCYTATYPGCVCFVMFGTRAQLRIKVKVPDAVAGDGAWQGVLAWVTTAGSMPGREADVVGPPIPLASLGRKLLTDLASCGSSTACAKLEG